MRFPWVSRGVLEAVERECNYLRQRRDVLERQQGEHIDLILAMKRDGFTAAPPTLTEASPSQVLPIVILNALDTIGLHGRDRAQMETWAWRQKERGADDAVVASRIIAGEDV